jgi:hypothetical protein
LYPSFVLKDENKAAYYLPSVDYVRGNRDTPPAKMLELAAKTSKGSKKRTKKSFKATKGSKKK